MAQLGQSVKIVYAAVIARSASSRAEKICDRIPRPWSSVHQTCQPSCETGIPLPAPVARAMWWVRTVECPDLELDDLDLKVPEGVGLHELEHRLAAADHALGPNVCISTSSCIQVTVRRRRHG